MAALRASGGLNLRGDYVTFSVKIGVLVGRGHETETPPALGLVTDAPLTEAPPVLGASTDTPPALGAVTEVPPALGFGIFFHSQSE